ncbi:MerR family transcriptional regulator [Ruania suaedae]|uniref:transcriptional regulator FtsR n=1 Tax=Ruania suaedae TaxID=2897774 RepID=UPI001E384E0B|nr:MerR family transcriptional regulator [Ruania suaedae]UFU04509.1 MerR family transcriptional regulator [Ruania suaedae]
MSSSAAREQADAPAWPFGVSRTPTMNISGALSVLKREFPAISVSKVRFLEDQGLVCPHRTPSGYRRYSLADVERLRFALAAQRDSFLPWKVIRERLAELDAGGADPPAPGARVISEDGEILADPSPPGRLTADQVARAAGCDPERVASLTSTGLLVADAAGKFPARSVEIVRFADELAAHGIDDRHLRALRSAADRQLDLVEQIVAPVRSQRTGPSASGSRAKAHAMATELTATMTSLHTALLGAGVDRME